MYKITTLVCISNNKPTYRFNRIHSSALALSRGDRCGRGIRWTCQWAVLVSNKLQRSDSIVVALTALAGSSSTNFSTGAESVLITCSYMLTTECFGLHTDQIPPCMHTVGDTQLVCSAWSLIPLHLPNLIPSDVVVRHIRPTSCSLTLTGPPMLLCNCHSLVITIHWCYN